MTEKDWLCLRAINQFNLDGPCYQNREKDANNIIARAIGRFISLYKKEIKNNYTFIINYDNDFYSALAYVVVANCGGVMKKQLDLRLLGTPKTPEEKQFFNGIKLINYQKAKKAKKAVLVTGFHPICNVINLNELSKNFIEIANPLERFTPDAFSFAQSYYFSKDFLKAVDKRVTISEEFRRNDWSTFFSYPICADNLPVDTSEIKTDVPIVFFRMEAGEQYFKFYDFILESSKEGNIHYYIIDEKDEEFLKTNLNPYLDLRNQISELNTTRPEDVADTKLKLSAITNEEVWEFTMDNYEDPIGELEESFKEEAIG